MTQYGFYSATEEMGREHQHFKRYISLYSAVVYVETGVQATDMDCYDAYIRYRKSLGRRKPWNEHR